MTYTIQCKRCGEWFPDHMIHRDEPMHECRKLCDCGHMVRVDLWSGHRLKCEHVER